MTSGKLNSHLADVNKQAEEMFYRLVTVRKRRKCSGNTQGGRPDGMGGRMNNIRNRVTEIINADIINS